MSAAVLAIRPAVRSDNALAIRLAVAATRALCPAADVSNVADFCISRNVPVGILKAVLFDLIAEADAGRPPHVPFRRQTLSAVLRADRRRV